MTPIPSPSRAPSSPSGLRLLLLLAAGSTLAAGCIGVPPGAADTGDSVVIRYTAYDLETSDVLRDNRTASFSLGDGGSGLGLQLERSLRGRMAGDSFEVEVRDDPSLDYGGIVEVNRSLQPIPVHQNASRVDFMQALGEPSVGQTFAAYQIYSGVVTAVDNDTVFFDVAAEDGQEDPVLSVGSTLVTRMTPDWIERQLRPNVGATFVVQPPTQFQPTTVLGLEPGAYQVLGATETALQFSRSASAETDLLGKDLRVDVTVLQVTEVQAPVPSTGNYGVRPGRQVQGDPSSVVGQPLPAGEPAPDDGHDH